MAWIDEENGVIYNVIANSEEQHSLWPAEQKDPEGWGDFEVRGTIAEHSDHGL